MKICFLTNELSFKHGWGRYSIDLIKTLTLKGHQSIVLLDKSAQQNDLKEVESYKLLFSLRNDFLKPIFIWKDYLRVKKIIKDCQLVHSLIEPYAPLAALLAKDKPFFVTAHGTFVPLLFNKLLVGYLIKRSFKKANKIFCISKFTQKEILKEINLKNTLVVNNGVDYNKWQIKKEIMPPKEKTILGVGVLKPRKGYHISVPAVAQVKRKYPNLKYYIVGSQENNNYFKQLKDLINKYHLEKNVFFLEGLSDKELIGLYHQADLFLLTPVNVGQKFEGFGLVYLEANACGKPVVGTYGCGAEDAIRNGFNGFLVPQNDIKKTAQTVVKILSNPSLAQKLGDNGKKLAQEMSWQRTIDKYLEIYQNDS